MTSRMIAPLVFVAACGANEPAAPDATVSIDAGDASDPTRTPVRFDAEYYGHSWVWNRCDRVLRMTGSEPMEPGRYPVAIFLVGTSGDHDYPGIVENVLPALARQGFVAASLEYENATLLGAAQNCNLYRDNAACMVRNELDHVGSERRSAVAQLCGRAQADCGKGVVFLGHSQGGLTAVQAFRFAPIAPPSPEPMPVLTAVAPMGVGPAGYVLGQRVIDLSECMAATSLAIDPNALLVINGEHDAFFNGPTGDQAGGQDALELVTGRQCAGPTWDCRGADGDGYVLVKPEEVSTGRAEHEFMTIPEHSFAEPNWIAADNHAAWSLANVAGWLRSRTRP